MKPDIKNLEFIERYTQSTKFYQQVEDLTDMLYRIKLQFPNDFSEILAILADPNKSIASHQSLLDIESITKFLNIYYESFKFNRRFPFHLFDKIINNSVFKDNSIPVEAKSRIFKAIEKITMLQHLSSTQKEKMLNILFATIKVINPEELIEKLTSLTKLWPENITEILDIVTGEMAKGNEIQLILSNVDKITTLLKADSKVPKNFATSFIKQYRNNIDKYHALSEHILNLNKTNDILRNIFIISGFACSGNINDIESNTFIDKLVGLSDEDLLGLTELFNLSPVPTYERILRHLNDGSISELVRNFPTNPFGDRTPTVLRQQFETSRVDDVLAGITDLTYDDEQPLTTIRRARLKQWFTLVNTIGQDDGYPIYKDDNKSYAAKDLSTEQIQGLVKKYRAIVADPTQTEKSKLTARLSFLVLAREMMYRTTGKFPNSTQVLTVANAMMKGGNLLSELATGQGKGLTSALLASVLWLEGQTVDVCTANAELASRDLKENTAYYTGLGIKHGYKSITRDSKPEDYCIDGINYSDVAQLAIFRGKVRVENRYIEPGKVSLISDECDFTILDDAVHYRYAKNLFPQASDGRNTYEWMYTAINEIMVPLLASKQPSIYLEEIRALLLQKANKNQQAQVASISDKQLDTWVKSSAAAIELRTKENIQFTVQQGIKVEGDEQYPISVAKIIMHHRVNQDTQWSNGVHQFLHALLEAERKEKPNAKEIPRFIIEPEIAPVVTTSSKNFLDYYRERGVIWGMSGTLGSKKERLEQQQKYGVSMFRIPSHQPNIRVDNEAISAENEQEKFKLIGDEIIRNLRQQQRYFWQRDGKPQPMLFSTSDAAKSKRLYDYLIIRLEPYKKKYPILNLQLFNGIDTLINGEPYVKPANEHRSDEEVIVDKAGLPGCITISTPMLGRGTDIKPRYMDNVTHKEGLYQLQAMPASERVRGQFIGRAGRQGQPGRTLTIVDKEELLGQTITEFQEAEEIKSSADRAMRDAQSDISNAVFTIFIRFYDSLSVDFPEIKTNLLREWKDYLEEIEKDWIKIVEEDVVDPNAANSGLNRVDRCAALYRNIVSDKWNNMVTNFITINDLSVDDLQDIQLSDKKIKTYLDSLRNAVAINLPTYHQFKTTPLVSDVRSLYSEYNPVKLLAKVREVDQSRSVNPKPTLDDTKRALHYFLSNYKRDLFKAKDRVDNVVDLEDKIDRAKSRDELFDVIIAARKSAMESDRAADKNATFFKRNLTGSRYQKTLIKMHNQILTEEKSEDVYPWMTAYHALQSALLHRPKYDKPKIFNMTGWKDLTRKEKNTLNSLHIKNVMPAVKEKIKESLLDGEVARWSTPEIEKSGSNYNIKLEVTIIRPDRSSYRLNTVIEIDTVLKTMTPEKPTLLEIPAPAIHQRQDSLWKIKKNKNENKPDSTRSPIIK